MPKMRKIGPGGRERCRESREFRPKLLKSLELCGVLGEGGKANREASREKTGKPGLTVQLSHNQTGIAFI